MIDTFEFDGGGDSLELELAVDPATEAKPSGPPVPPTAAFGPSGFAVARPSAVAGAPILTPSAFGAHPTPHPAALPMIPSYRSCVAHDLPMDSYGDCPLCAQARQRGAEQARQKNLVIAVVAVLFVAVSAIGIFAKARWEAGAQRRAAAAITERYKTPVVVFTTQSCSACKITRNYMDANNVPYTERSLDGDPVAVKEFDELVDRRLVPVVIVGDEVQEGFSQLEFERAMARHDVKRLPPGSSSSAPL